jgi:phosphate uptake regulator
MLELRQFQEVFAPEFRQLTEDLTEMALMAEEMFAASVHALLARDRSLACRVAECVGVYAAQDESGESLDSRMLSLLHVRAGSGGSLRTLLLVQQSAQELGRVGEHCRRVAMHALALTDGASGVAALGREAGTELLNFIRAVYGQLRGGAELLSAPDRERAHQLAATNAPLDQRYRYLVEEVQERIVRDPPSALALTRLLFAVHEMKCIGDRIGMLCEHVAAMLGSDETGV